MTEVHQRYRVVERLASGGMAEVFLAESAGIEGFKKQVAIKKVLPHLSEKTRFIAMFLDEARLSAHLSHSNVAQVFDIGVGDNAYFIVMEYVDGADLKALVEHMKRGSQSFPVEAAALIAARVCEGLAYAHDLTSADGQPLHIVHRDVSPPNILITKYGEVKIVDFGLAKAASQLEKSEVGIIKGKFSYLSPEAAIGQEVDHRADIFALGIILWELLSGRRLFLAESDFQTVKLVQEAVVPSISQAGRQIPQGLINIVNHALAKNPNDRYFSARDMGRDLTTFLFEYGKPIGSFDLSLLVHGAMTTKKKSAAKASLIDKLIEEALLEFTSIQGDHNSMIPGASLPPVDRQVVANWAEDLNRQASALGTQGPNSLPVGNLASLEDDTTSGRLPRTSAADSTVSHPSLSPPLGVGSAPQTSLQPGAPPKRNAWPVMLAALITILAAILSVLALSSFGLLK